ncbi:Leucine-rich repeat-containing protein 23 [Thoreauomyces humboldtii]|nr:Leucine-rich repeat-containing protein 23 [Thoreauomyces humboldtii]
MSEPDEDTSHHGRGGGDSLESEAPVPDNPLTVSMITPAISLLSRTGNGLSHAYTQLNLVSSGITDISILKTYPHLRYLDLSQNHIRDVTPLAQLEFLLSADLHGNRIERVGQELSNLKWLQNVDMKANTIREWDVPGWPLCGFLNLDDNALSSLALPEFSSLLHLSVTRNTLESAVPLKTPKLQKLYLSNNPIGKLTNVDLDDKSQLQVLHLRECGLESLAGVGGSDGKGLTGLVYLNLRGNNIHSSAEIDHLAHINTLKILVLSDNPICSHSTYRLEVLARLAKLDRLDKDPITDDEREEASAYKIQMVEKSDPDTAGKSAVEGEGGEQDDGDEDEHDKDEEPGDDD